MPANGRHKNRTVRRARNAPAPPLTRWAWLSPPIGAVAIVAVAAAASLAQSTSWIAIAASLLFSLCEGVILALVGYAWLGRGLLAAVLVAAATAAVAAPARWEITLLRLAQPLHASDLVADLAVSIAWGAVAGLAGGTILRPQLAALMHDSQQRFSPRRPN